MNHSIKYITPPENCTGCGLCANVCPKNTIRMVWSKDGFLVPKVNAEACINCGLCVKQCIAFEDKTKYTDDLSTVVAYGGWNKDMDIHLNSSSGGVFTALAEYVIAQGGVVFGVVWQDKLTAVFDKTETVEGLSRMRGSKYTTAVNESIYQEVHEELQSEREVLFCGTPCQVHALKKFLRKPYAKLLTVDIVCHGMPSHLILEKYVAENEDRTGKTIDHVSFREKPDGWQNFHVACHYTDGSKDSSPVVQDMYMKMFLSNKALNKVCYNCPYAHIPRQGDITLGDYWGVWKHHSDWPIDKGVSAILENSARGKEVMENVGPTLHLRREPFSNIYRGQSVVYTCFKQKIPQIREIVLTQLSSQCLRHVYDEFVNKYHVFGILVKKNKYTTFVYKTIIFPARVIRFIKKKLTVHID